MKVSTQGRTITQALLLASALLIPVAARSAGSSGAAILRYKPSSGLIITGTVANIYAVLTTTNLANSSAWRCLNFVQLPVSPYLMPGTALTNKRSCFYRVGGMTSSNLIFIPAGTFTLGSPTNEVDRFSDESPQTAVTFSRSFWIGQNLVTQQEYQSVMGSNPSAFTGNSSLPVEQVTWTNATNYCALRTVQDRAAGRIPYGCYYRLPTEAEWEFTCRAGTATRFNYGDDPGYTNLVNHAWYNSNSGSQTKVVGGKPANSWGLYDMHGNVWEWCQDWYDAYPGGSVTDPQGPATADQRVLRGGSWADFASLCRSACRISDYPDVVANSYGFRVVLVASGP